MFQISDKVVCVDDSNLDLSKRTIPGGVVKKGEIYCVSGMGLYYPNISVCIVGKPAIDKWGIDLGWHKKRFRKISDIKAENRFRAEQEAAFDRTFPST